MPSTASPTPSSVTPVPPPRVVPQSDPDAVDLGGIDPAAYAAAGDTKIIKELQPKE